MHVSFLSLVLNHNNIILPHLECPRGVILSDDLPMKDETQLMDSNSAPGMLTVRGHHPFETYNWIDMKVGLPVGQSTHSFDTNSPVVVASIPPAPLHCNVVIHVHPKGSMSIVVSDLSPLEEESKVF